MHTDYTGHAERANGTRRTPERALTPDEALDILSHATQRAARRVLELRAAQAASQAQQGHPEAATAPEQTHDRT